MRLFFCQERAGRYHKAEQNLSKIYLSLQLRNREKLCSLYHPQSSGKEERMNQSLKDTKDLCRDSNGQMFYLYYCCFNAHEV